MIRRLLCIGVFLLASNLNAQEPRFGAKAGINFATLDGDVQGLNGRTSFHLGLVAEFASTGEFSVQPELLYSNVGATASNDDDAALKLSYISIPVMAKYYIVNGLSLEAGPQVSFNIAAKADGDGPARDIEGVELFELAAGFGAGYLSASGIFFQARYVFGIHQAMDFPALKNRVFQLSTGYKF